MVALSMSLFKRYGLKLRPEITPGVCPYCEFPTSFISIVHDRYKCMHCGEEVEQKVNGVIKYLPLGSDKLGFEKEKEHG